MGHRSSTTTGRHQRHPCGFLSKTFSETERNYDIYDREMLGIIRALKAWKHYLIGSPFPTFNRSDHKNLTYFQTTQKLNRQQVQWSLFLSEFKLHLIHVPGSQMIQSDALSRRPDHVPEEDTDNKDQILLPGNLFQPEPIQICTINLPLRESLQTELGRSAELKSLQERNTKDWTETEGIHYFQHLCYIPESLELQRQIVARNHDTSTTGYPGIYKTTELVKQNYWWPGMNVFIKNYVIGCPICQQMKINTHPTVPPLQLIKAKENARPFSTVTLDFITDLSEAEGYNSILTITDHDVMKGVIFTPCRKTVTLDQSSIIPKPTKSLYLNKLILMKDTPMGCHPLSQMVRASKMCPVRTTILLAILHQVMMLTLMLK